MMTDLHPRALLKSWLALFVKLFVNYRPSRLVKFYQECENIRPTDRPLCQNSHYLVVWGHLSVHEHMGLDSSILWKAGSNEAEERGDRFWLPAAHPQRWKLLVLMDQLGWVIRQDGFGHQDKSGTIPPSGDWWILGVGQTFRAGVVADFPPCRGDILFAGSLCHSLCCTSGRARRACSSENRHSSLENLAALLHIQYPR